MIMSRRCIHIRTMYEWTWTLSGLNQNMSQLLLNLKSVSGENILYAEVPALPVGVFNVVTAFPRPCASALQLHLSRCRLLSEGADRPIQKDVKLPLILCKA